MVSLQIIMRSQDESREYQLALEHVLYAGFGGSSAPDRPRKLYFPAPSLMIYVWN